MTALTRLIQIRKQNNLEKVIPKLECFDNPARYKLAEGGRGGAKSWTYARLISRKANYKKLKILCCREVQKSIKESVYELIKKTIQQLGYPGWVFYDDRIENKLNGSRFIFNGLKDARATNSVKSFEDVDICWVEEGHAVSKESWDILRPTIRKENSEIWVSWNAVTLYDPVNDLKKLDDVLYAFVTYKDNPYFPEVLEKERLECLKKNPLDYDHIWGGLPRNLGDATIIPLLKITEAEHRQADDTGAVEIGADIARFGNDKTVFWKRKGMMPLEKKEMRMSDTMEVAHALWDFAGHNINIPIKIDEGYNPGVVDVLSSWGAKVIPISFGGEAQDKELYANAISEMWFTFPIDEISLPDDPELKLELTSRKYKYDNKGRKMVESKDEYKKRSGGNSPDNADAFLLCYYTGMNTKFDNGIIEAMKARRKR